MPTKTHSTHVTDCSRKSSKHVKWISEGCQQTRPKPARETDTGSPGIGFTWVGFVTGPHPYGRSMLRSSFPLEISINKSFQTRLFHKTRSWFIGFVSFGDFCIPSPPINSHEIISPHMVGLMGLNRKAAFYRSKTGHFQPPTRSLVTNTATLRGTKRLFRCQWMKAPAKIATILDLGVELADVGGTWIILEKKYDKIWHKMIVLKGSQKALGFFCLDWKFCNELPKDLRAT